MTVSACMVHPATDGSHAYHLDAATYTADAICRHGTIPSMELSHSGMSAGTYQRGFGDTPPACSSHRVVGRCFRYMDQRLEAEEKS